MKDNNLEQNEPKRNFKKRILLLILLLLVTGVMLSTSTYAWFTANETVSVSNIRVNIASQNGIQISADASNWKSILQTTDLTGAHATYSTAVNQIPTTLEPVSTIGTVTAGKMEMWYGNVVTSGNDFILTSDTAGERDNNDVTTTVTNPGKFIAFDIFLKVTTSTPVYLTSSSGITTDDVTDTGIKNASRVGFLTLGNKVSGTDKAVLQALAGGDGDGPNATGFVLSKKIWEPNYDTHTSAGVSNANDTYGITTTTVAANNTQIAYDGVKAAITAADNILLKDATAVKNATKFATVTPDLSTKAEWTAADPAQYLSLMTLDPGVTKVRVYFWVEGQDVDCENSASGGNIILNLQITTNNGA